MLFTCIFALIDATLPLRENTLLSSRWFCCKHTTTCHSTEASKSTVIQEVQAQLWQLRVRCPVFVCVFVWVCPAHRSHKSYQRRPLQLVHFRGSIGPVHHPALLDKEQLTKFMHGPETPVFHFCKASTPVSLSYQFMEFTYSFDDTRALY